MNEYGFDYMNYITNIPSNMMNIDNKFNASNIKGLKNVECWKDKEFTQKLI